MKKCQITAGEAVTYRNYFRALKRCNKSVNYKFSVQNYNVNCIQEITESIRCIRAGNVPEIRNQKKTIIRERGKTREITPIDIVDRVPVKVQCDNVLIPSIVPHMIYDNGASLEGKGTEFARRRAGEFIESAKLEYGPDNLWVIELDLKRFFDNIPRKNCRELLRYYLHDESLIKLNIGFIEQYDAKRPGYGLCLGSQESQIMAVAVLNPLDHYIKDVLGIRYYVRYMDDGILIVNSRERAKEVLQLIDAKVRTMDMELHDRKTRIVNARNGFTFLKIKYQIIGNRTVKRLTRQGIVRERRRLKKLQPRIAAGRLPEDEIYQSMQSWNAHAAAANRSWRTEKEMFHLYDQLYGGYRLTRKFYRQHPEIRRKKKVTAF